MDLIFSVLDILKLIGISVVILLTLLGNFQVIISLVKKGSCLKPHQLFVISLASADVGVAIFIMFPAFLQEMKIATDWFEEEFYCLSVIGLDVFFCSTSILHLFCMTIERYFAICKPFKYKCIHKKRGIIIMLIFAWVLAGMISLGFVLGKANQYQMEHMYNANITKCLMFINKYLSVFSTMIIFYIPATLMIICNFKIFWTVRITTRGILNRSCSIIVKKTYLNRETIVARTNALLIGCFLVCWIPFFVKDLIRPFVNFNIPSTLEVGCTWLGYINSTINPYLYYLRNHAAKKRCPKLLMSCFKKNSTFKVKNNDDDSKYDEIAIIRKFYFDKTTCINDNGLKTDSTHM